MRRLVAAVITAACVLAAIVIPAGAQTAWTNVINEQFTAAGIPYWMTVHNGNIANFPGCWDPGQVMAPGDGYLHMKLSYHSSYPAGSKCTKYGSTGAGWYSGGASVAPAYQLHSDGSCYLACDDQRITIRYRIVSVDGIESHRVIPMASPLVRPDGSYCAGDGEIDYLENDGPPTGLHTFIHYGGCPFSTISHSYGTTVNVGSFHTYQFVKRNYQIHVYGDGALLWSYAGSSTTLPDSIRKLSLWQGCQHAVGCPTGTTGYEDIQIDWVKVDNPG